MRTDGEERNVPAAGTACKAADAVAARDQHRLHTFKRRFFAIDIIYCEQRRDYRLIATLRQFVRAALRIFERPREQYAHLMSSI
jgi:hypothetical protein